MPERRGVPFGNSFGKDGPGISSEIQVYFFDSTGPVDAIDFAVLPCVTCNYLGQRLGHGGGYYDRYLETHPGHKTIALAYEFQILHELPAEPYDKSVDMIVTEKRVIRCSIK